jgi:Carbamoyltransferase C-terminus/ABC-2 type transporter
MSLFDTISERAEEGSTERLADAELPLTVITPPSGWRALNLNELWNYRELAWVLTERDIKVRYKQTALGFAWAIIQPVMLMVVFSIFFGGLAKMPSDGLPYPIFVYAGLLPWTFFSNAIASSANSLVGSANLLSKVYLIRADKRRLIPAVTHVDGSGRLQSVYRQTNPRYWKLIEAFRAATGVPIVLNTSFNENEPIVCRPEEALDCFLRTQMDVLVMGSSFIHRHKS